MVNLAGDAGVEPALTVLETVRQPCVKLSITWNTRFYQVLLR